VTVFAIIVAVAALSVALGVALSRALSRPAHIRPALRPRGVCNVCGRSVVAATCAELCEAIEAHRCDPLALIYDDRTDPPPIGHVAVRCDRCGATTAEGENFDCDVVGLACVPHWCDA